MTFRTALVASTAAATLSLGSAALADCEVDEAFGFARCAGTDTDGVRVFSDSPAVIVEEDAVVTADDTAVEISAAGSGDVIVRTGARVEGGEVGIASDGSAVISVSGTVAGRTAMQLDGFSIFQVFVNEGGEVRGAEDATGVGIDAFNQFDVALRNRGSITAGGTAVGGSDRTFVTNEGLIESTFGLGAQVGDESNVRNSGTIRGAQGASIRSGEVINDSGALIEGTDGAGLTIVASGLRTNFLDIVNEGTIRGEIGLDGRALGQDSFFTFSSAGVIEGTGGTAIVLGDVFTQAVLGTVIGDVIFGDLDDSVSFMSAALGGEEAGLFDLGGGEDEVSIRSFFATSDIASVVMSDAITNATELRFVGGSVLTVRGAELFTFSDQQLDLAALLAFSGNEVPLPGAALFALTGLGLGARLRRR